MAYGIVTLFDCRPAPVVLYVPPAQSVSLTDVVLADVQDSGETQLFAPFAIVHVGVEVNDAVDDATITVDVATVVLAVGWVVVAVVVASALANSGIKNREHKTESSIFFIELNL